MILRLIRSSALHAKLFRFAIVGGVSTLAYGFFTVLNVEAFAIPPLPATVLGYLLAIPLNFVLHRQFTFRSKNSKAAELPRFVLIHGLNILGTSAVMFFLAEVLRASYLWGVASTMLLAPLLVFIIMDRWVFRHRSADQPSARKRDLL